MIKDPDEEVAAAISDVLAAFTATGSAYQVVACFADHCPRHECDVSGHSGHPGPRIVGSGACQLGFRGW